VEVIHSGDVLMWPGYSNISVQPVMTLLGNKKCGVASAYLLFCLSPPLSSLRFGN
jgi:hypothetical protein